MAEKKSLGMFEVVYILMLAVLLIVSVVYMGKPRIGIINLAIAAQELGVTPLIEADVTQWREIAAGDLKKVNEEYMAVSKGMKAEFDKAKSDEQKSELKKQMNAMSREYSARILKIKGGVQEHQQRILLTFRKRINPFITEIARKRKLWIVFDNSARLVYSTKQVDITGAVIEASRDLFFKQESLLDADATLVTEDLPAELSETK